MTLFMLLIGCVITLLMLARPFLYKPIAVYFPAELSSAFTSVWVMFGVLVTLPFFYDSLNPHILAAHPIALAVTAGKGIILWLMIKYQQVLNKVSTSSSVFYAFIAMAFGTLLMNLFFGENLSAIHLSVIVALGVLGFVFMFKGDLKRLSKTDKFIFTLLVCLMTYAIVSDHISINAFGWYPHLVISTLVMLICSIIYGISKTDLKNILTNPKVIVAGFVYTFGEFVVTFANVNIMPVSFVSLFNRLSAPLAMIISAKIYHEQTVKNQALFGLLAFALSLIIIFT